MFYPATIRQSPLYHFLISGDLHSKRCIFARRTGSFPYVTFPSLDSLNISYCSSAQAMAWPIKPTYRSQKIVMQQISMNCVPIAPDEIRELLGSTPDLCTLELQGSSSQTFDGISTSCLALPHYLPSSYIWRIVKHSSNLSIIYQFFFSIFNSP